jgi:hypothetical protein
VFHLSWVTVIVHNDFSSVSGPSCLDRICFKPLMPSEVQQWQPSQLWCNHKYRDWGTWVHNIKTHTRKTVGKFSDDSLPSCVMLSQIRHFRRKLIIWVMNRLWDKISSWSDQTNANDGIYTDSKHCVVDLLIIMPSIQFTVTTPIYFGFLIWPLSPLAFMQILGNN